MNRSFHSLILHCTSPKDLNLLCSSILCNGTSSSELIQVFHELYPVLANEDLSLLEVMDRWCIVYYKTPRDGRVHHG